MSDLSKQSSYLDGLLEQIKTIDTSELSDDVSDDTISKVIEEQRIYFWIRLYLNEEDPNVEIGDDVTIQWTPTGEELKTKFAAYAKAGLERNHEDEVTNYNPDDDKRVLCLMIDTKMVNSNDDIPFIRTLFKTGYHYEYQLVKRNELIFTNDKNGVLLDYYDCDF
jgi:hypothetical protein